MMMLGFNSSLGDPIVSSDHRTSNATLYGVGAAVVGGVVGGWVGKKVGWVAGAIGGAVSLGFLTWAYVSGRWPLGGSGGQ